MGILRALGFGIFLLILSSLMPSVFTQLSQTSTTFLESSQEAFAAAGVLASYSSSSGVVTTLHLDASPTFSAPSFTPPPR